MLWFTLNQTDKHQTNCYMTDTYIYNCWYKTFSNKEVKTCLNNVVGIGSRAHVAERTVNALPLYLVKW